jgi:hypothetical protein
VGRRLALAAVAGALLPAAASAAEPLQTTSLVRGQATAIQQRPGPIARGIGDVNGDGRDDVALAVNAGISVVYGASPAPNVDLAGDLGARGFRVDAGSAGVVWDLGGAGDFDRDGFDDLLISTDAAAYIVYGAASTTGTLTLAAGPRVTALTGKSVSDAVDEAKGIGDFDGDGYADVAVQRGWIGSAIISGGPRVASIPVTSTSSGRASLIGASQRCAWVLLTYKCVYLGVSIEPAGDFDGDGLDDLVIENTYLGAGGNLVLYGRTGRFTTPATAGTGKTQLPPPTRGEATGIINNTQRAGDVNGDGLDDVVAWHSVLVLGRRGRPTAIASTDPVITLTGGTPGHYDVEPAGDQDGNGTGDLFVDQRRVLTAIPRTAPASVAVDTAPLIGDLPSGTAAQPAGDLDGDGAPDGLAGADTSAYLLTHQSGSPGPFTLPATLDGTFSLLDAGGQGISGATWTYRVTCNGQTGSPITPTYMSTVLVASGSEGDACAVAVEVTLPNPSAYASCSWQDTELLNNQPLRPAGGTFKLAAGANRWVRSRRCVIAPTTYPTSLGESAWVQAGSVRDAAGGTPTLTSGPNQRGSLLWPAALDYRNRTIEFSTFIYSEPGVIAGEGMTVAFVTPDASGKPAGGTLGWGGPLLGFGGLSGVAVAFDTRKSGTADPSSNFIGFTNGYAGASLRWLQTADAGVPLTSTSTHAVKIVNKAGTTTVFIDGVQRMQGPLPIGASSFLAFTAATSSAWQAAGPWYLRVTAS